MQESFCIYEATENFKQMNFTSRLYVLLVLITLNLKTLQAQQTALSAEDKEQTIDELSRLMNDFYVFPAVAKNTEEHLRKQLKEGHFNAFESQEAFADALTASVQSINKDKHMRIRANRPYEALESTPERMLEERLHQINRVKQFNGGFNTVQLLEGNVAYLDIRAFAGLEQAKELTDAYMKLMARADAVIIDLTQNGGGSPRMVQYLCSYFFDQKLHLNSLYWRQGDHTEEYWTLDEVGGTKMPNIPLFVLLGEQTFSGAEEFSYNMQTQKRATLVGQTSGGGANPGRSMRLNEHMSVFIPTGRAINPITKTSWEGTGVVPEVLTEKGEELAKAHELAKQAAQAYREQLEAGYGDLFFEFTDHLNTYEEGETEAAVLASLSKCIAAGFLEEWDVNIIGYEYLMQKEQPKLAQAIFEANTKLFPQSANVFDSYAESLLMSGDVKKAVENYQKAVDIATENEDRDLELYQNNLEAAKQQAEK